MYCNVPYFSTSLCYTVLSACAAQGDSSSLTILWLQWGPVRITNTTLTCVAVDSPASPPAPTPTLVAETAHQLQWGIQLLGQLQPSTITLARDMSVPADGSWPVRLFVNRSMVLAGLPPPAPRTVLDMFQVRRREVVGCGLWVGV